MFTDHLDLHVTTHYALNIILGVFDVAADAFASNPLSCGGMIIDTKMCLDQHATLPCTIQSGLEFPLRKTGDAALFRGSTHVHRTLRPPVGFVVYKLVIFQN